MTDVLCTSVRGVSWSITVANRHLSFSVLWPWTCPLTLIVIPLGYNEPKICSTSFREWSIKKKKNVCEIILKAVRYCGDQNKLQESRRKKRTRNFQERSSNFSLDVYINISQSFCELYTLRPFLTVALWGGVVVLQMRKLRLREIQEKSCAKSASQLGI